MSNWGCNFHPPKSGEYLGPSNPPCICSFWSSPNSSAAAPQWKPLLVAPIAQTQHCFVSSLEMPPFNGRTSFFFLSLLVFPSIIFEGGFLFSFPGSELKTTCFWESCFLCFHWNLSFNEMIWNKKNQQILDLPSTQDATSSWICDSSMRMEKVPSKNLLPNGGRLDGDFHPMVKTQVQKSPTKNTNPSFVAPRFFQLNFENLQTNQPVHHPCSKRVLSLVCSTCRDRETHGNLGTS